MMELQGAVGLAQLLKLPGVVEAQRRNQDHMIKAMSGLPGLVLREVPENSYQTADALVFFVKDIDAARRCRKELMNVNLTTKILPEALTWHFAAAWNHMPQLVASHGGNLQHAFPKSQALLSRSVSLPVLVKMPQDVPQRIRLALEKALNA
jgi:8-amino-3,8-dideoxy-alpha-D-manno-octulosonate transaminase